MNAAHALPLAVVIVATCCAAVTDIRTFKIYHTLTVPLFLGGIAFRLVTGGWPGLADSLAGAMFGFCCLLVFFILGGMGAGDVKLMAAVGAWLGMPLTFYVFVAASLAAGVYAIALLVLRHGVGETLVHLQLSWLRLTTLGRRLGTDSTVEDEVKRDDRHRRLIPFAAMILVGIIAVLIWNGTAAHHL
jgi:prepilin peptidase CpaA